MLANDKALPPATNDQKTGQTVIWHGSLLDVDEASALHPGVLRLSGMQETGSSLRRVLGLGGQEFADDIPFYLTDDISTVPKSARIVIVASERERQQLEDAGLTLPCVAMSFGASEAMADSWAEVRTGLNFAFVHQSSEATRMLVQAFTAAFEPGEAQLFLLAVDEAECEALLERGAAVSPMVPIRNLRSLGRRGSIGSEHFHLVVVDPSRRDAPLATLANERGRALLINFAQENHSADVVNRIAFDLLAAARAFSELGALPDEDGSISDEDRRDALSWQAKGRMVKQLLAGPMPAPSSLDGIGWLTRWNVKCGIGDHAAHQVAGADGRNVIVAPHEDDLLRRDGDNVVRCWTRDYLDEGALTGVSDVVYRQKLAAVFIHFNWAFYHPAALERLIIELRSAGRVVFIDMHSTSSARDDQRRAAYGWRIKDFEKSLRMCDRVFVHQQADLERIKAAVPDAMATIEPLGISTINRDNAGATAPTLIGCFGFCFPNKGLEQLVLATFMLRQARQDVQLLLLNAEHPLPESQETVAAVRRLIDMLGLTKSVTFVTDYLEESECMKRLGRTALIVNPYQRTSESASAAGRYAMASGVPLLVTPLPIFDDLGDAVFRAKGTNPEALAEAIRDTLSQIQDRTLKAQQVEAKAARWRDEHDLAIQTRRIVNLAATIGRNRQLRKWTQFVAVG